MRASSASTIGVAGEPPGGEVLELAPAQPPGAVARLGAAVPYTAWAATGAQAALDLARDEGRNLVGPAAVEAEDGHVFGDGHRLELALREVDGLSLVL